MGQKEYVSLKRLYSQIIGGSIGAWAGMRLWHHKTMHNKFKYGILVIIILQIALVAYLHTIILRLR